MYNMNILYKETLGGVSIQRCYGLDGVVELPEEIDGKPVTELERYVFSRTVRGREVPPAEREDEPEISGEQLKELSLPPKLKKVGAYAFYNCTELEKISFYTRMADWGAGVFTGCSRIKELDVHMCLGEKSGFQDMLLELCQTLLVNVWDENGTFKTKLIFPEFFEESVENTPARIIMREMHGCGHKYRYCFDEATFNYREYDSLFPYVQVQEKPELVTRLALYRLYWPWGLTEEAKGAYWEYVNTYAKEAARGLIQRGELELLKWTASSALLKEDSLENMVQAAAERGDAQASALLMNEKHRRFGGGPAKRRMSRTFEM